MLIYSKYHHRSYKNIIPRKSYETYESLTPMTPFYFKREE
jgi:hypothetical protein